MPVAAQNEQGTSLSLPNYFENLSDLDNWVLDSRNRGRLEGLVKYTPRSKCGRDTLQSCGKLLVCHDYKGGYTESPSTLAYTFNFWDQCDTFIYFSHQRVTIPPPGWVNAAHRQGVKIFGVLIFEHQESMEDTLRLLLGNLPQGPRSGAPSSLINNGLPVSRYYARLLADLALERGFDGYLLNFEYPFPGRSEQARALEAWISLLNSELLSKVGEYASTIWYDSIITTGDLRWQDRLNSRNVSFFLSSGTFFSNYTWPSHVPSLSAQYFLSLDPTLFAARSKTLRDIYIGIDVWGRGSHGGGGLGLYRAAEHIDPAGLGLSVAIFGPAWSWESDEGEEGWSWDQWWDRERTLWVGPAIEGTHIEVPDAPLRKGEPPCVHGEFKPLGDFFKSTPPPNPDVLPFCTTFCPGVGFSWFVEGRKVMRKKSGWTDIDKQTSLGNLLWPHPKVAWEGTDLGELLPKAASVLNFDDAYNGSSSLKVNLSGEGSSDDGPSFRCFWIPVQSLALTPAQPYQVDLVYKVTSDNDEFDLASAVKGDMEIDITPLSSDEVGSGWTKLSITCKAGAQTDDTSISDVEVNVGIILAIAADDGSQPYSINIHLGQLAVFPIPSLQNTSPYIHRLFWADCSRNPASSSTVQISWDDCISFTSPATIRESDLDPEVPHPPWTLDRAPTWFPRLQYANVYAEACTSVSGLRPSSEARFVGTSGWGCGAWTGGGPSRFIVERDSLPEELRSTPVRFYVQGVTDRGTVLPWESCAFVDFDW